RAPRRIERRISSESSSSAQTDHWGGPNHVVRASRRPWSVPSEAHARCPSGRTNTAVGASTAPSTGSSHTPAYRAPLEPQGDTGILRANRPRATKRGRGVCQGFGTPISHAVRLFQRTDTARPTCRCQRHNTDSDALDPHAANDESPK